MILSRMARNVGTFVAFAGGTAVLASMHDDGESLHLVAIRVSLLTALIVCWRPVVDTLIAAAFVHRLRRAQALAFRWRALAMFVLIELCVIQQLPALVLDTIQA